MKGFEKPALGWFSNINNLFSNGYGQSDPRVVAGAGIGIFYRLAY